MYGLAPISLDWRRSSQGAQAAGVVRRGESFELDISIGDANAATREAVTTAEFLCTDLDGSLLLVDSFWESSLALVGKHFWYVFLIPFWSLRPTPRSITLQSGYTVFYCTGKTLFAAA